MGDSRWRAAALSYLRDHAADIVAEVSTLVRIPSISGSDEENSILEVIADRLHEAGAEVDHWKIPLADTLTAPDFPGSEVQRSRGSGLVGRVAGSGGGRTLMLNGHVDVVPPGDAGSWPSGDPFDGAVSGGRVYGRGSCDMKGGVVAARWALQSLTAVHAPLQGDLLLACVIGEEDGGLGTYATLRRGWRADACVIAEPTSLDLVPANGGALTFRLQVTGLAAHASRRTAGVSTIEKFLPIFGCLRALEAHRNRAPDPLMSRWDIAYPIEIGQVRAGDWSSSVPDLLIAEGRYGVCLDETPDQARQVFEAAVAATVAADPWLREHPVRVQWWGGQFASSRTPDSSPINAAVSHAHASVTGHLPQRWGAPYGSDLRLMNDIGRVPTVQYGPGDVSLAHGPHESVPIAEVLTAAETLAVLAIDFCGVS